MSLCIGHFMIVREPNGNATVYDEDLDDDDMERRREEGEDEWEFHGSLDDARRFVYDALGEPYPADLAEKCEHKAQKAPCDQCPFRRKAAAGWLGQSTPEGFIGTILIGTEPLPCHSTINYERTDWRERFLSKRDPKAKLCAGALILQANTGKVPREGPSLPADRTRVFSTFAEFIEHHRAAHVRSWTDDEGERYGLDRVRRLVGLPILSESAKRR